MRVFKTCYYFSKNESYVCDKWALFHISARYQSVPLFTAKHQLFMVHTYSVVPQHHGNPAALDICGTVYCSTRSMSSAFAAMHRTLYVMKRPEEWRA